MSKSFKIEMSARVKLVESDETGKVIGRAEYDFAENSYLVRYKAGDGRQVESWITESALSPVK